MSELQYWEQQLRLGRISRREFMHRLAVLGGAAALSGVVRPGLALAAEPKRGGSPKIGLKDASATDSLDPATWPASFTQTAFNGSLCNNLTEIAADGKIVCDLAESYESSAGAKRWTFKLRRGITFHNGKSLTPTDVIETIRYHAAPNSSSGAKPLLKDITDMKADGPDTVVFELAEGSADFPYLLADYHLSIMPAKDGGGIEWQKGIGTGAFALNHFQPGVSAKMTRNPNYHKPNKPYFDEVEFLGIPDDAARSNALMTGEIDFMNDCDLKTVSLLGRSPDVTVTRTPSIRHWSFDMDTSHPPFDNPDVRMALKLALDRDEIIRKVYLNEAKISDDNPIGQSLRYWSEPKPRHELNIEMAKQLLKKAGLASLTVDLSVAESAFPGSIDAGVLYQAQAAKAGITINLVREADDGYWENVWLKKPFNACDWYGRATCDWQFSTVYADGAAWNNTHWKNARFNDLLVQARAETDDAKRGAAYAEMQQIVHDDGGLIVVAYVNYTDAHSKRLAHGPIGGTFPNDNLRIAERWWMA